MVIQPHPTPLTVVVIWMLENIPFDVFKYLKIALKLQVLFNLCSCWHTTTLHVLILKMRISHSTISRKKMGA